MRSAGLRRVRSQGSEVRKQWLVTGKLMILFIFFLLLTLHSSLLTEVYATLTDESTLNLKAGDLQQQTGEAPGLISSFVKLFAGLAVVLGVMLIAYRFAKERLNKANAFSGKGKLINVIATQYLAPKKAVMLIEVAGERLVVGVGEEINLLVRIEDISEESRVGTYGHTPGQEPVFSDALKTASEKGNPLGVIDSIKEKLEMLKGKRQ